MKKSKVFIIVSLLAVLIGMSACSNSEDKPESQNESKVDNISQDTDDSSLSIDSSVESESSSTSGGSNGDAEDSTGDSGSEISNSNVDEKETLSQYTTEQIEYARIWLQLGPNQEIDELYVRHIPEGEPINPNDDTSASYPEDVIQLAGTRLVDGSVTYSGNGDGTINVYEVPLRWDGNYPVEENFYIDIIENSKLVSVDTSDDEEIIELIKLLSIH